MRSIGFRFLVVGLLTLLMVIPLFLAAAVIDDRAGYAEDTRRDVSREWGGAQTLTGPILMIPVEGEVQRNERREVPGDVEGETRFEEVTVTERGPVMPILLMPERLDLTADTETSIRRRGIFEVPVYSADIAFTASYNTDRVASVLKDGEVPQWGEAKLRLGLGSNAGLRGETSIRAGGADLPLEPFFASNASGVEALIGDPRGRADISAAITMNGAQELKVSPVGRITSVAMAGDWPDPSFTGAFLPDERTVTETGYEASWTIPHLARTLPQISRGSFIEPAAHAFGTAYVQVNDFYQKAFRAARYGILFIALTFLTVLLTERRDTPTHPVQYILIGLAQSIFVLLMVAYAEQIGFTAAYLASAAATIALLTLFGWTALKLGVRTLVLGVTLLVLYGVLFLILRSNDQALLAGATLAFGALALTMILTRNENWYGAAGPAAGFRLTDPPSDAALPPTPAAKRRAQAEAGRQQQSGEGPWRSASADAGATDQVKADSNATSTISPKED